MIKDCASCEYSRIYHETDHAYGKTKTFKKYECVCPDTKLLCPEHKEDSDE